MVAPVFEGEVMLAGWKETHNGGATVTFWLPDASELDAFRGMTVRKGNTAGQRLACVLVEIGDDEQPKEPENKPKGGALAKLAGQLCADPQFQQWAAGGALHCTPGSAEAQTWAADFVRANCGVKSRADLDHDSKAALLFHDFIRKPWLQFKQEHL